MFENTAALGLMKDTEPVETEKTEVRRLNACQRDRMGWPGRMAENRNDRRWPALSWHFGVKERKLLLFPLTCCWWDGN